MEIEIVSRENVKPSSPTPSRLRTYNFSLIDQLYPTAHVTLLLFYKPTDQPDTNQILQRLKQSLSQTLTAFYPFAGKIKDDLYIDCNDDGNLYVEAKVNCSLSELLQNPDTNMIWKLLPEDNPVSCSESTGTPVALFQVNVFNCGGIAIATKGSHRIIDGPTSVMFLKAWAGAAWGSGKAAASLQVQPSFLGPSLFPQNKLLPKDVMLGIWPSFLKFGKSSLRRFVFDASAIAELKSKAANPSFVQYPSRFEAVSAFIWQCIMLAAKSKYGVRRPSVYTLAVNFRGRMGSDYPVYSVGNHVWMAAARCSTEAEAELDSLVSLLRESIKRIDERLVESLKGEQGFFKVCEYLKEFEELYSDPGTDYISSSSMCKGGVYDIDFGWGKPIWVTTGGQNRPLYLNLVLLNDTSDGDGIETLVNLGEDDMAILQRDTQILSFASMDPSPLQLSK